MELEQQEIYHDNLRSDFRSFIPPHARSVLDVGCGRGGFGRTLRDTTGLDARIIGIDAVHSNVAAARANNCFDEVLLGYFPDDLQGRVERSSFDLITFMDVLEHMLDPWTVLEEAKSFLSPGGTIIAAIPSIQVWTVMRDLSRGQWTYTESGILDRTHVRFFTKTSMRRMFEDAGYVVETCRGMNSKKPPMRSLLRSVLDRRFMAEMKWLPYLLPESEWLHYVIVARLREAEGGM